MVLAEEKSIDWGEKCWLGEGEKLIDEKKSIGWVKEWENDSTKIQ